MALQNTLTAEYAIVTDTDYVSKVSWTKYKNLSTANSFDTVYDTAISGYTIVGTLASELSVNASDLLTIKENADAACELALLANVRWSDWEVV